MAAMEQKINALSQTIEQQQRQLTELDKPTESNTGSPADAAAKINELNARLAALESAVHTLAAQRSSNPYNALNALWMLRYQLDNGTPYKTELAALEKFTKTNPTAADDLTPLKPLAESGIKTVEDLRGAFPDMASEIIRLSHNVPQNSGWLRKTLANFNSLIVIRRIDDTKRSDRPDAVVHRAELYLNRGDLNLAVLELEKLPSRFDSATLEWVSAARARLAAETTVAALYDHITAAAEDKADADAQTP